MELPTRTLKVNEIRNLNRAAHRGPWRPGHARGPRLDHQLDVRGQVQPRAAAGRRMAA